MHPPHTHHLTLAKHTAASCKHHTVQFYDDERFLCKAVSYSVDADLRRRDAVLVVAIGHRCEELEQRLQALGHHVESLKSSGQLTILDAKKTLAKFMAGHLPDGALFRAVVGVMIEKSSAVYQHVRVYGEMVDVLLAQGNAEGTLALEELWNKLAETHRFTLVCSYVLEPLKRAEHLSVFADLCQVHSHVIPTESYLSLPDHDARFRTIALWQQKAGAFDVVSAEKSRLDTIVHQHEESLDDLRRSVHDAEAASLKKTRFLANMSHEIRTPLGAILGFSDLLRSGDVSAHDRQRFIDTIARNGHELMALIDDILDLSKVEAGMLSVVKEHFSLPDLLTDISTTFSVKLAHKGLELQFERSGPVPDIIYSDPTRLRQILLNLISNALKFTKHGSVKVSMALREASPRPKLEFLIEDSGCGIDPTQVCLLFQPFSQIIAAQGAAAHTGGGTGLGLALSRQLARLLGGDLTLVQSTPKVGSIFALTIDGFAKHGEQPDKSTCTHLSEASLEHRAQVLDHIKILFADDCEDNRDLVQHILSSKGADVDVADNGEAAVSLARSGSYDLVLMDIQMPVLDGYRATKQLRALGFTAPIIALTAHAMCDEQRQSILAGCNEHLSKPIDSKQLIATVSRYARGVSVH